MKEIHEVWETYRSCWNENDSDKRLSKLRAILSDKFEYRDPNIDLKGYQELSDYMEQFQNEYKGASFEITDLTEHHSKILAKWSMLNQEKEVLGNGLDFASYKDGKLTEITGFFKES